MEDILHYVWKFRLFDQNLKTTTGTPIEVIDPGLSNPNEGPDFFNAKIKIDDKTWAGNVEIHTSSDDWQKHKHDTNKKYNSVILHIVKNANCEVSNQLGQTIPQCEIKYPSHIDDNYSFLVHADKGIPCRNYIQDMPSIHLNSWMYNLLVERLERKSKHISELLMRFNGSWDDTFYILLCRNLGFGLNSDSFERLALSLPYKYIQKQGDSLVQIEALLFGQAGMLANTSKKDAYSELLQREYDFLKNKYELTPIDSQSFKTSRPAGFPQIRIAQLAALLHSSHGLFSKITGSEDIGRIRLMFHINASEYWQTHYEFATESGRKSKYLGDGSLDILLINTVVPIIFSYGKSINNDDICQRAIHFLEIIKPEKNTITKDFAKYKISLNSAADSQAMIQLKREYCELRKCLYCRIGHRLLSRPKP